MNLDEWEDKAWHNQQLAQLAQPDATVIISHGKEFHRMFAKVCPWCRAVFYTYKRVGADCIPFMVDPEPVVGRGVRETCGHPLCHTAENNHAWRVQHPQIKWVSPNKEKK